MLTINNTPFMCELSDVLDELASQLALNGINYLQKRKDGNDNIAVSCPYHGNGQERHPSAGIHKQTGVFHCFACDEVHTLPELISHVFGYPDDVLGKWGWGWLLKNFMSVSAESRSNLQLNIQREIKKPPTARYVTEEELDSYRYTHPYMYFRKLNDEIIEKFDIGYDPATRCITFPVRDETGGTLFIARRSVDTKYFNYPAGAEKPVYGLYELSQEPNVTEVIICESMLDALTAWVYGKHAVALNGTGNALQYAQLNKLSVRKFILATDNDVAGKKARGKLRQNLHGKLISEYVLPDNRKDLNELSKDEFDKLEEVW